MNLGFNAGTHQRHVLPDLTPIARRFPIESLPAPLWRAAIYVAKNKRISTTIAGMTASSVPSLLTMNLARFKMPGDKAETRPASTYSHVIAPSGAGKTRAIQAFIPTVEAYDKAMIALHEQAAHKFDLAHGDWADARKVLRKELKKLRVNNKPWQHLQAALDELDKEEPIAPVEMRLLVSDITTRRFIDQLNGSGRSIGLVSDEADIVYENLPRLCRHLNRGFDGSFITLDRAGGESVICHDPRISVLLMAQNEIIDDFERAHGKKIRSIGFWGRNLFGTAAKVVDEHYLADVVVSSQALDAYHATLGRLIAEIDRRRCQGITMIDEIELDDEALRLWRDFENEMLRRMNSDGDIREAGDLADVADFASRAAEHAGRLATIWTVVLGEKKISLETIKGAIEVVRFHLAEFQDRYSLFHAVPTVVLQAYALDKYLHRLWSRGHRSVPKGFIERNAKDDLRDVPNLDDALDLLRLMSRIQILPGPGRGQRIVHIPQPGIPFRFSR